MTLQDFLLTEELTTKALPYKQERSLANHWNKSRVYTFKTEKAEYAVVFKLDGEFEDKIFEVAFGNLIKEKGTSKFNYISGDKTNFNEAPVVFATIYKIIEDFLISNKPNSLTFFASGESNSRLSIYRRFVRDLTKKHPEYSYGNTNDVDTGEVKTRELALVKDTWRDNISKKAAKSRAKVNKIGKLKESLNEGIGERTLYHFTDYAALNDILKSEALKMRRYHGTEQGEVQLCTVRKSMECKANDLSGSSNGGVKIIIDASKLIDSVRGVKIKKVAEYPRVYMEDQRRNLQTDTGHKFTDKELNSLLKDIKTFQKKYNIKPDTYKDIIDIPDEQINELKSLSKKYYNVMVPHLVKILRTSTGSRGLKKYTQDREGEERITKKGRWDDQFPINKKYIKIEITKPSMLKAHVRNTDDDLKDLEKNMRKHKDLFVQNENYDLILSALHRYNKGERR